LAADNPEPGRLDKFLRRTIQEATDFIPVLSQECLVANDGEVDWVHKEIEWALKCKCNIVPVLMPGFTWPQQDKTPASLLPLRKLLQLPYPENPAAHKGFMSTLIECLRSKKV
jgi:hypothetical protein